ncbi:MAG: response regulator [Pseudolabrys sp.]
MAGEVGGMREAGFTTFLVDDDPAVLRAITRLLNAAGYTTKSFSSPQEFLSAHDPSIPGCAIIDLVMSELDGLHLQQALIETGSERPIIFLTGKGDVSTSVRAMKAGAVDFLTKPVKREALFSAVVRAAKVDALSRQRRDESKSIGDRLATLTHREREVLAYVIAGRLNKQIAASIGTVEKTVKVHRGRMMAKLGIRSVADLVRLADKAGIAPAQMSG